MRSAAPLPAPAPKLRCAIYTRKSSDEGLDQEFNSLDAQRDACEAYVLSQAGEGWQLHPERYDDGGFSGGNIQRPALQRLLRDVEAGRVQVVVLYKVDRLTRSLGDFSKIVEVLDRAGASFVSVTQAFNTTTSMGRLTLNMLLSFAQFEREVTGERIRDKIAASKRKGMWMGGPPPLGYDPDGRTLKINGAEAESVRTIFQRNLELPSVTLLVDELRLARIVSKRWEMKSGKVRGGVPFHRGALYYLLSNRIYIGEIPHKGANHKGLHTAIIDRALFDAVAAKLLANGGDRRRARAGLPLRQRAPLTGHVFDEAGTPLSPSVTRKADGSSYRYYAGSTTKRSSRGRVARAPAAELEALVADRVGRLVADPTERQAWPELKRLIQRITVSPREITIDINRASVDAKSINVDAVAYGLPTGETLAEFENSLRLVCCATFQSRAGNRIAIGPNGAPATTTSMVDLVLLKALVRAEAWKRELLSGATGTLNEIVEREAIKPSYARRLIRLAFLSPALKSRIVNGKAPAGLTLQLLMTRGVADSWKEQEAVAHG